MMTSRLFSSSVAMAFVAMELMIPSSMMAVEAASWAQFRGPDGSGAGVAEGLPVALSPASIAWTATLPGKGHSSPIAWGPLIFLTAEAETPGKRFVVALDGATGKERWRYEDTFEVYAQHKLNSYAASTPVADAERVYVSWLSGKSRRVLALTHDGKKAWEQTLGQYEEEHGSSASPVIFEGMVLVPNDHGGPADAGLFALDAATGKEKWRCATQTPKTAFSTPLVVTGPDGKKQIILSSNPVSLLGIDPTTGKKAWQIEHPVNGARAVSSPVWADGVVFATVGQGGNGQGAVAVKPGSLDGKTPPEMVWEATKRVPYVPTPVALKSKLYCVSDAGLMSCVDAATGKSAWEERALSPVYSSPVCFNDHIYAVSRKGELIVAKASPERFEKVSQLDLGEECQTTPSLAQGRLLVRTNTKLFAIGGVVSKDSAKP